MHEPIGLGWVGLGWVYVLCALHVPRYQVRELPPRFGVLVGVCALLVYLPPSSYVLLVLSSRTAGEAFSVSLVDSTRF